MTRVAPASTKRRSGATRPPPTRSRRKAFVPALNRVDSLVKMAEHALLNRTVDDANGEATRIASSRPARSIALLLRDRHRRRGRVLAHPVDQRSDSRARRGHARRRGRRPLATAWALVARQARRVRPLAASFTEMTRQLSRARQAQGGIRVRRVARAQDADQRHGRLPPVARRRHLRPGRPPSSWRCSAPLDDAGEHARAAGESAARRQSVRGGRRPVSSRAP